MRTLAILAIAGCGRYGFARPPDAGGGRGDSGGISDATDANGDSPGGDGAALGPRLVFATLSGPSGAIGGLDAADTMCTSEANAGGRTGAFRAVLGAVGMDPATRIVLAQGRTIVLPDGKQVATDATFFTATHDTTINEAIDASVIGGVFYSWTNFSPAGAALANDCLGWTDSSGINSGGRGLITATDSTWADAGTAKCNFTNHLICIEQ